jgi:predicted nucleic acid-binding OB-fold protein
VAGSKRKLLKEDFLNLYFSSNIIKIIKLRRIILTRHVAGIEKSRNKYTVFVKRTESRKPLDRFING